MRKRALIGITLLAGFILSACASTRRADPALLQETVSTELSEAPAPDSSVSALQPSPAALLPYEPTPRGAASEFSTDFSKHTVSYSEILSGGPPKDGIPAIDAPVYESARQANNWLRPREPVILVEVDGKARAYPLQILIWHEIVNDTLGELPLAVTFCPLCNTAIAFQRSFDGQVLDFGTTGRLRYSNLIMYDRQTESWWQQANGEAIAGRYSGAQLEFYPAVIVSWQQFFSTYPDGSVLSRGTGFDRQYGQNPYAGYDDVDNPPLLYAGPQTPDVLPPVARVLTVDLNDDAVAYPYDVLKEVRVVNDTVGGQPVAVFWVSGTASALDHELIAAGRAVGSTAAYSRVLDGRELKFQYANEKITDLETGSEWNVLGQAVAGDLAGTQLSPVVSINHFWFSWAAFKPETRIFQP